MAVERASGRKQVIRSEPAGSGSGKAPTREVKAGGQNQSAVSKYTPTGATAKVNLSGTGNPPPGVGYDRAEMGLVKMHYNATGLGSSQLGRNLAFWSYATAQAARAGLGSIPDQAELVKKIFSGEYITADKTGVMQALSPMYAQPGTLLLDNFNQQPGGADRKAVFQAVTQYVKDHPKASQQEVYNYALGQSHALGGSCEEMNHRAVVALATVNLLSKVPGLGASVGLDAASEKTLDDWSRTNVTLAPPGGAGTEIDRNHHFWVHALNTSDLIARKGVEPATAAEAVRMMGVAYEILSTGNSGLTENAGNASLKDLQINNAGVDFVLGVGGPSDPGPALEHHF